jgi:transporter family-2 protein
MHPGCPLPWASRWPWPQGLAIPVQGRINGALVHASVTASPRRRQFQHRTDRDGHRVAAGSARPRRPRQILPALRERRFPPYYALAGGIGAFFVFAQSFTVGLLGIALFTVATVTGQTLSGLLVDRLGIGPAGKKSVTGIRSSAASSPSPPSPGRCHPASLPALQARQAGVR